MRIATHLTMVGASLAASVVLTALPALPRETPLRRANRLYEKGRFAEAVAAYTAALDEDPGNAAILYNRALANEMVNREQAVADWRRFLKLAGSNARWQPEVAKVEKRVEALQQKPALPAGLQPNAYVPQGGDYYDAIAVASEGEQWTHFPVKVFMEDPPAAWQGAVRRALDEWGQMIPLAMIKERESADIAVTWGSLPDTPGEERLGAETDSVTTERRGKVVLSRRRRALVVLNTSRRWSEAEMHVGALHELGHALGILGHSTRDRDVMFPDQQVVYEVAEGGESPRGRLGQRAPPGVSLREVLPGRLSAADINTLIRLYNCAGPAGILE